MTHDGAYPIVIPMAWWHQAANDDQWTSPLRRSMSPAFEWAPFLICVGLILACILPLLTMKD